MTLPAAKARGVTLGNPRLHAARKSAVEAVKTEADRFTRPTCFRSSQRRRKAGAQTLREIADALNARGIATARGGQSDIIGMVDAQPVEQARIS